MAIQEVTGTSWFGRIGNSIKGILVGLVLVVVSLAMLVLNERNAVRDIRANKEIGREVASIVNDEVSAANEGKLVHLNGPAKTEDIVQNKEFGIEENAIRLSWESEIYQWVEEKRTETKKKLGGGEQTVTTYTYEKKWADSPVDSSHFKEAGHTNPGRQEFKDGSAEASHVTLGAFTLPGGLISQIRSAEPYQLKSLPAGVAVKGKITDGIFHTGDPGNPRIGDEKVSFKITRPQDVSVMAVQTNNSFSPYQTKSGKTKFLLYEGLLTAEAMVEGEKKKAAFLRWALRGGGVLLMFIGFSMLLKPLSVLADVVPLFGSLVGGVTGVIAFLLALGISLVVVAIAWITFRPMVGIPLLVVGAGCFVMLIMKMRKGKSAAAAALPPIPQG